MKRILALLMCVVCVFLLASCVSGISPEVEETKLDVQLTMNKEKSANSRVCLNTNLPVGTKLNVDIFVGNKYHSKETVQVQADIESNYFITESQVDIDGNTIEDGNYILSVELVDPSQQLSEVRTIIGQNGEKLKGLYTYDTEKGKTVKLQRPIVKKNNSFSMPDN